MGLKIAQNKIEIKPKKSLLDTFEQLKEQGKIDDKTFNHFNDKIKESGLLHLKMNNVLEREKAARIALQKTDEYQKKMQTAKWKKGIKAAQEQNNDEIKGALELILIQLEHELPHDVKKQLMM